MRAEHAMLMPIKRMNKSLARKGRERSCTSTHTPGYVGGGRSRREGGLVAVGGGGPRALPRGGWTEGVADAGRARDADAQRHHVEDRRRVEHHCLFNRARIQAHRLWHHSTLGSRVITKKKRSQVASCRRSPWS